MWKNHRWPRMRYMFIDLFQHQTNSLKGLEDFLVSSKRRFLKFKERKKKPSAFFDIKDYFINICDLVLLCHSTKIINQQRHYEKADDWFSRSKIDFPGQFKESILTKLSVLSSAVFKFIHRFFLNVFRVNRAFLLLGSVVPDILVEFLVNKMWQVWLGDLFLIMKDFTQVR